MATLLQIAQAGNPMLRQRAETVDADIITSNASLQALIDNMLATCQDADGVGIAAPQVYVPQRVIVVASKPSPRYPDAPNMDPLAMINPVISVTSTALEDGWEGCLSMPGLRAIVPRYKKIAVSFLDRNGGRTSGIYEGFVARVIQHEVDHLDGKMFSTAPTQNRSCPRSSSNAWSATAASKKLLQKERSDVLWRTENRPTSRWRGSFLSGNLSGFESLP